MHSNPSQAMFSDGLATICAARFEQLCGSRATFYFCVSTLTICESMSRPRGVVTPEELSCVLKPFVTSRSWLVYDESGKVSESKLHKGNALKHVALLTALHEHSPSLVFTRSVVTTAFKQLVVQFGMSQDASKDWVETMTNRLQNLCRTVSQSLRKNPSSEFASTFPWSPTATDTAAEPWLHCGVRSRTPFCLAWDRTSRDVEPALCARGSATNRLTDGTLVRRVRAHNDRHHVRRAPSDSGCRQQTGHANCCVERDPLREQASSVRETETR